MYTGLMEGPHTFDVFATNLAGIADPTPATFSWTVSLTGRILSIVLPGTGKGSVANMVYGISCNTGCSSTLPTGAEIVLSAIPGIYSIFDGWSVACTGTDVCMLTLLGDTSVTATFTKDLNHMIRINGLPPQYFPSLIEAYKVAPMDGTIQLWGTEIAENTVFNREVSVVIAGGYDRDYLNNTGMTTIQGGFTIKKGKVSVNRVVIGPLIQ
jgi:hypothetical protein